MNQWWLSLAIGETRWGVAGRTNEKNSDHISIGVHGLQHESSIGGPVMALPEDQIQYLHRQPPGEAVARALSELLVNDPDLLGIDANERSITFCFAMYLQQHFAGWAVDCEYNIDGVEPKRLGHLELYPDSEDDEAKTVFPDVIVHRRQTKENHLVLEFKKSTSRVDRQMDLRKLRGYKRQLGYEHALFVEVGTAGDPTNLVQNTLTAVRTLEQINNQIQQLQNEAQMLINQARNLARLPSNVVGLLRANLATTQRLIAQATQAWKTTWTGTGSASSLVRC